MLDEPDDDHEGEENVERKRNGKVRKGGPLKVVGRRALVDVHDAYGYITDVSPEYCHRFVEKSNAYLTTQGTRGRGRR